MSQDNTNAAHQIAAVEVTSLLVHTLRSYLERLRPDVLSEEAVLNLQRLAGEMVDGLDALERSTYKLLD